MSQELPVIADENHSSVTALAGLPMEREYIAVRQKSVSEVISGVRTAEYAWRVYDEWRQQHPELAIDDESAASNMCLYAKESSTSMG